MDGVEYVVYVPAAVARQLLPAPAAQNVPAPVKVLLMVNDQEAAGRTVNMRFYVHNKEVSANFNGRTLVHAAVAAVGPQPVTVAWRVMAPGVLQWHVSGGSQAAEDPGAATGVAQQQLSPQQPQSPPPPPQPQADGVVTSQQPGIGCKATKQRPTTGKQLPPVTTASLLAPTASEWQVGEGCSSALG